VSSYSSEDLPSNALGIKIAADHLAKQKPGYSPGVVEWGSAMDVAMNKAIKSYEPMTKEESVKAYNKFGPEIYKKNQRYKYY
jgi:hypothetical protein